VHGLGDDEFFDLENFSSRGDFLARVHTYQLYFNLVHPNSHKDAAILVEGGCCSRSLSLLAKKFRRGIVARVIVGLPWNKRLFGRRPIRETPSGLIPSG